MTMYKEALRPAWVEINLDNLRYNIRSIQEKVGEGTKVVGVVKADAYGHGSVQVAQVLREAGIQIFAVATLTEGITLREAGAEEDIICLGLTPDLYADTVAKYDIIPAFCSFENAKAFSEAGAELGKTVRGIIDVDTGMGRIGFQYDDVDNAAEQLLAAQDLPNFEIYGMFSHFCTADATNLDFTRMQQERYTSFYEGITGKGVRVPMKTLDNSAGIMRLPETYFDASRAGIILYGLYPSQEVDPADLSIKPVMSVKANIVHLKEVGEGFSCGYGRKFIAERPSKIATLNLGYADGYPRPYSPVGKVIVNGVVCPLAGNICMDQCMVDVTDVPDVELGDEVIIMGTDGKNTISADDIADATGTINYEITCAFGQRLPKVFVESK